MHARILQYTYTYIHTHTHTHIYIYIYIGWVQVILGVTLSNITLPNNLLLNSYFENPTVELHVLYVLSMHTNFMLIGCNLPFNS